MQLNLVDRINFDAASLTVTGDGYLVATPRISRTGIQLYRGSEVGMKDKAVVRVYRPEAEVFHKDSMNSLAHRPLTNDHPSVPVTADNWKEFSVGQSGGEVVRDGEFVRVPMAFMDAKAIKDIKAGKKQLSVGYSCDLEFKDGMTPDGQPYDAIQTNIRGNHIALVKAARGGDRLTVGDQTTLLAPLAIDSAAFAKAAKLICDGAFEQDAALAEGTAFIAGDYAIGDGAKVYVSALSKAKAEATESGDDAVVSAIDSLLGLVNDHKPMEKTMAKTILVDGVSVEFATDQSAQIVQRALDQAAKLLKDAEAEKGEGFKKFKKKEEEDAKTITELTTAKDGLTAEVATLKKSVEDSKLTPQKLDQLVADRAVVSGKAKAVLGDKLVVDGKTDAEIKRQVVDAKLGDKAKGWTDDQVSISFDTLTADVKPGDSTAVRDARVAFSQPGHHFTADAGADLKEKALDKRDAHLADAWKNPNGAPATH